MSIINDEQIALLQDIVDLVEDDWESIGLNVEIDEVDGDLVISPSCYYSIGDKRNRFKLSADVCDSLESLRSTHKSVNKDNTAWTICDIKIADDGNYSYEFSYNTPPRISKLRST
ncbi:hypothetical protein [Agaribacterium sp. ZY112]|uniref:hypothetical protein n=1 Tax=Agaribacterium sp. ZY112 TaxID=3233574 RepID=UPI003524FFBA